MQWVAASRLSQQMPWNAIYMKEHSKPKLLFIFARLDPKWAFGLLLIAHITQRQSQLYIIFCVPSQFGNIWEARKIALEEEIKQEISSHSSPTTFSSTSLANLPRPHHFQLKGPNTSKLFKKSIFGQTWPKCKKLQKLIFCLQSIKNASSLIIYHNRKKILVQKTRQPGKTGPLRAKWCNENCGCHQLWEAWQNRTQQGRAGQGRAWLAKF